MLPRKRELSNEKSRSKMTYSKIISLGVILLIVIIFQSIISLPKPALAAADSAHDQRATLPPEWTATFTASPVAETAVPLPTMTLGGQTTATVEPIGLTISAINGKQVIVDVDFLTVYTGASSDALSIEKLPRGAVRTILAETQNPKTHETWWYIFDSFGWIPAKTNDAATTRDYSSTTLNQMIEEVDKHLEDDAENPMWHLQKGWMYFGQSNYSSAISEITTAINMAAPTQADESPLSSELYFYRGKVYIAAQNYMNALDDFDEAIKLGFQEAVVYGRRGLVHQRLQHFGQARLDYLESIRLNPNYALTYNNLGSLLNTLQRSDPDQLIYFTKAVEVDPYFPYGYSNRASYYQVIGDVGDHVIDDLTTTLQLVPHDETALNLRGIVHSRRQEFSLAVQDFNLLIELYPDHPNAYTNRGIAYGNLGDTASALKDLKYAVKLGDPSGSAYYNLAIELKVSGQYLAALYCYNKAIELNPYRNDARINRGILLKMLGAIDENVIMAYPSYELLITPMP